MEEDATGTTSMERPCEGGWRPMCSVCALRVRTSIERSGVSKYIIKMIGGKVSN